MACLEGWSTLMNCFSDFLWLIRNVIYCQTLQDMVHPLKMAFDATSRPVRELLRAKMIDTTTANEIEDDTAKIAATKVTITENVFIVTGQPLLANQDLLPTLNDRIPKDDVYFDPMHNVLRPSVTTKQSGTGSSTTGSLSTGSSATGSLSTSSLSTSSLSTISLSTGLSTTGSLSTGSLSTGSLSTGSSTTSSSTTGSLSTGSSTTGSLSTGSSTTGSLSTGSLSTSSSTTGSLSTGSSTTTDVSTSTESSTTTTDPIIDYALDTNSLQNWEETTTFIPLETKEGGTSGWSWQQYPSTLPSTMVDDETSTEPTEELVDAQMLARFAPISTNLLFESLNIVHLYFRLCLFNNICTMEEARKKMRVERKKTTTTTTTSTTTEANQEQRSPRKVDRFLIAQIQRCIQTPEHCSTKNLVSSSPLKGKTTTTTENPLETAKRCVLKGDCPEHTTTTTTQKPSSAGNNRILSPTAANNIALKVRLCLFAQIC